MWSEVLSFRTTPNDPKATVTIGLSGDSRGDHGNAFRLFQRRMKTANVDFQLFSGDMINFAPDQGEWEHWLDSAWRDADDKLVVRRETIEELIGRPYDLQELQINLITMSGNLDQTDDEMILYWNA